jgi:hypothetical protein
MSKTKNLTAGAFGGLGLSVFKKCILTSFFKWIAEDGNIRRQLYIDDDLRIDLNSDSTVIGNVFFNMAYTSSNGFYTLSTLDVKDFTMESFRPLPV